MGELYKYPSLWRYFPSAILHFVLVEVRTVFAAVASWHMLCWSMLSLTDTRKYTEEQQRLAVLSVSGFVGVPAALLLLYGLLGFVLQAGAPASCGSGAYLGWTWRLERSRVYQTLVVLMCLMPAATLCMVFYDLAEVWLEVEGRRKEHGDWKADQENIETLLFAMVFPLAVLLVALYGLTVQHMSPNGWDREQLDALVLARSWPQCFLSNDLFGLKLVDALWKAENGRPQELRDFLACPQDESIVMHVCRECVEEPQQP